MRPAACAACQPERSVRRLPDLAVLGEPGVAVGQRVGEHPRDPTDLRLDRSRFDLPDGCRDLPDPCDRFLDASEDDWGVI